MPRATSTQFPLYDELDDDSIEEFRRRLFFAPFGGGLAGVYYIPGAPSFIDPKFDPRFYALRSGLQGWVTSPSTEIADDLAAVRMGMRHRLQTKRGAARRRADHRLAHVRLQRHLVPRRQTATTPAPTSA